jgi:hypothetical protein
LYNSARDKKGSAGEEPKDNKAWDSFKNAVYGSVDGVQDIASKIKGSNEKMEEDRVGEGYADFEESVLSRQGPAQKIMGEYQARATSLGVAENATPPSKRSGFDNFKENVYTTVDALSATKEEQPEVLRDEVVPIKRSLAKDFTNQDLQSPNPIKRFKAEQKIVDQEAQRRAGLRNEKIRAKKEDLYKLVDSFQASVDALPETFEQTSQAVKDMAKFVKSVPSKAQKAVDEVKAIPTKVQERAAKIEQSVENSIDATKQVYQDVKDIPNKVNKTLEDTKRKVASTKESVDETYTKVRVLIGVEKPKPKPPKLPPPKAKDAKEIALDLAGKAAAGTGQFAWWATKGAANMAWTSATSALGKSGVTIPELPQLPKMNLPELPQQQKQPQPQKPPPTVVPTGASDGVADTKQVEKEVADALKLAEDSLRKTQDVVPKGASEGVADTEQVEKEVADALKLAEDSLRKAQDESNK